MVTKNKKQCVVCGKEGFPIIKNKCKACYEKARYQKGKPLKKQQEQKKVLEKAIVLMAKKSVSGKEISFQRMVENIEIVCSATVKLFGLQEPKENPGTVPCEICHEKAADRTIHHDSDGRERFVCWDCYSSLIKEGSQFRDEI